MHKSTVSILRQSRRLYGWWPLNGACLEALRAGSSPSPRAVGAVVISPALQRGVGENQQFIRSPVGTALMLRALLAFLREEWKIANRERLP